MTEKDKEIDDALEQAVQREHSDLKTCRGSHSGTSSLSVLGMVVIAISSLSLELDTPTGLEGSFPSST